MSSTPALEGIPQEPAPDITRDRAAFDGLLLNAIAYGALLMLCAQLVQSLYLRPKRGRSFYYMIAYAVFVFAVTTIAVGGRFVTAEQQFIDNRMAPEGPTAWFWNNSDSWQSIMTFAGTVAVPWVADLLMMYRIHVLWNRRIWFIALPALLYLTGIAISVPFIISMSRPHDPTWAALSPTYKVAYVAVMSAFNIVVSITIFVRLFMLRNKVVQVMGKVPAIMYNSPATLLVETATFYTIWITCYLVLICRDSYAQDVFLQGAVYVLAITRIHILERMVTHTAWSKDIVSASAQGVLDWEISSVHSHAIPMHTTRSRDSSAYPASSQEQEQERIQNLPKKFRDDNMVF